LPDHVVQRARELLEGWRREDPVFTTRQKSQVAAVAESNGHIEPRAILDRLSRIDPLHTTPMEALSLLAELKRLAESDGK
jgi:DNA mismatch repair ATPase MutS